jgi:arylsulfatase A-like enzyme
MTGRHPVRTGCITAMPGSGLVAWEVTIADKLKELGYSNAIFGKWHITDWFPTLLNMIGHKESVPTDRVIDGCDQSAYLTAEQEHSNRVYFPMFFDRLHVGMRYKNFKVLTHKIEHGLAPTAVKTWVGSQPTSAHPTARDPPYSKPDHQPRRGHTR